MGGAVKRIAVLGSTGSIGQQTLDVVRALPGEFRVIGLAAGKNLTLLAEQIKEFKPDFVSYSEPDKRVSFGPSPRLLSPEEIASHPDVELVVMATSGKAGLAPTLAAIDAGKTIALANKEVLVMAGEIVTCRARDKKVRILPVDSEHSAIWQCLNYEDEKPSRLILTASGGPFYRLSQEQMEGVTVEQALKHPSWKMGKKVTIDSATLMNKGLEVIEAHWLFEMPFNKIEIVIHPQSIIHSMVEFVDGAIKAQLSSPDMRLPIQYALTYPKRLANPGLPLLDWSRVASLAFAQPDLKRFPCLALGIEAGTKGGTYPAALCGADEVAVELFLAKRIKFTDIPRLIERVLGEHRSVTSPTLDNIVSADAWAREKVRELAGVGC